MSIPKNDLLKKLEASKEFRNSFPMARPFDLEKCLGAQLHEPKFSKKGRKVHKVLQKYTLNDAGLTVPIKDPKPTYSAMGACIQAIKLGAYYLEPFTTEPPVGRHFDRRYPINNMRWDYGFNTVKALEDKEYVDLNQARLDMIKFLLDNKVIELDSEKDRQKAVEMGLIKIEIPTFGDDDE